MKALGVGLGAFGFHDVWVERDRCRCALGRWSPWRGPTSRRAARVTTWHLSITHSDTTAAAYVIVE